MGKKEGITIASILVDKSREGWRLFRNSVGLGWVGKVTKEGDFKDDKGILVHAVQLINAYRMRFGLEVGSSDLIGWRPVVITADMVGSTIAQFASVEVKTTGYKRTTVEQKNWLEQVAMSGGYAAKAMPDKDGGYMLVEVGRI